MLAEVTCSTGARANRRRDARQDTTSGVDPSPLQGWQCRCSVLAAALTLDIYHASATAATAIRTRFQLTAQQRPHLQTASPRFWATAMPCKGRCFGVETGRPPAHLAEPLLRLHPEVRRTACWACPTGADHPDGSRPCGRRRYRPALSMAAHPDAKNQAAVEGASPRPHSRKPDLQPPYALPAAKATRYPCVCPPAAPDRHRHCTNI